MLDAGENAQHPLCIGPVARLAEHFAVHHYDRIRRQRSRDSHEAIVVGQHVVAGADGDAEATDGQVPVEARQRGGKPRAMHPSRPARQPNQLTNLGCVAQRAVYHDADAAAMLDA